MADLRAPHLLDLEVLSVLRRRSQARRLDMAEADRLLQVFAALTIQRHASSGHLLAIWALRHNLTTYDAAYVALSARLDCPLITLDRALAASPQLPCQVELLPLRPSSPP